MSSSIESEEDDSDATITIQESSIDSIVIEPLEEEKVLLPPSSIQISDSTGAQEKPIDLETTDDTPPSVKYTTTASLDDEQEASISPSVVEEPIVQEISIDEGIVSESRVEEPFDETAFIEEDEDDFWADFYVAGEEDTTLFEEGLTMSLSM